MRGRWTTILAAFALLGFVACGGDNVTTGPDTSTDHDMSDVVDMGDELDVAPDMVADATDDLGPEWLEVSDRIAGPVDDGLLPSFSLLLFDTHSIEAAGAVGLRRVGAPTEVTVYDKHHLSSGTKSMTATVAARLVERGDISWDSNVAQTLGVAEVDPALADITLQDLLTHQAGFERGSWTASEWNGTNMVASRRAIAEDLLTRPPENMVGGYVYSNVGYVVAGAMLEQVSGMAWEELMQTELFDPLDMESCGFGWPATPQSEDQPWPHHVVMEQLLPLGSQDRWDGIPPSWGPAGTVHCSLFDWAKFGQLHLGDGGEYLEASTLELLHTGQIEMGFYLGRPSTFAFGWVALADAPPGGGTVQIDGTVGHNISFIFLDLDEGNGLVMSTNVLRDGAFDAMARVAVSVVEEVR